MQSRSAAEGRATRSIQPDQIVWKYLRISEEASRGLEFAHGNFSSRALTSKFCLEIRVAILVLVAVAQVSCSTQRVSLTPEVLLPRSIEGEGASVYLSPTVEGIPDPVGRRTMTLLHIPYAKVRLDDGPQSILKGLRDALEATGYRVILSDDATGSPILVCRVSRMKFRSNNWAAPIIFISGEVELTLSLVESSGGKIWERSYRRRSHDNGVRTSFEHPINEAFNKSLAAAMFDFASSEFREACCSRSLHNEPPQADEP